MGRKYLAVLSSLFFAATGALAQQTGASISGTVNDPSDAHIVAAIVIARNVDTGVTTPVTTNEAGVYSMPSLLPGKYQLAAEHPGFRKAFINDVILEVGAVLTININLELGQTTETVEVQAVASAVNATSASVGGVVDGKRLVDLPLVARSAYDLLVTQPGVSNGAFINGGGNMYLNGNQGASVNFTMDGITAMDNLHNSTFYMYTNVASVDRVAEFRVVTSPADAEYGRGTGQVQMVTRGGTNRFSGSVFEEFRNDKLNANAWFNNAAGSDASGNPLQPRQIVRQNNYGIRFGGPLKKNRTFFNGIYEPFKVRNKIPANVLVYTPDALAGNVRFFPGVVNGNVTTAVPTVDTAGNPLQPAAATGPLQTFNVLGRDPNYLTADNTGIMKHVFSYMPLPNNYRIGDGLNTAGFAWSYPFTEDFELYEGRIDHNFNDKQRLSLTLSQQSIHNFNYTTPSPFPTVPGQFNTAETTNYTVALTSVLKPSLLNDARIGIYRTRTTVGAPYSPGNPGVNGFLSNVGGYPTIVTPSGALTVGVKGPYSGAQYVPPVPGDYLNPNYQWGDTLTWIKGRHSFKGGFQLRYITFSGFDFGTANNVPTVQLGANAFLPITNISTGSNPIPGIGQNATVATNLLTDLAGAVLSTTQTNFATGGKNPVFLPGQTSYREWHQNEFDWFFKDDFKVSPSLTLNLGIRWELYRVPYEAQGRTLAPAGGGLGVIGAAGKDFGALFNPFATGGAATQIQAIGPGSANPGIGLYHSQLHNFGPAVGLSWAVPGTGFWKRLSGGPNRMTIRMGYGIGYQRNPIALVNTESGAEGAGFSENELNLAFASLGQVKLPLPPAGLPLSLVPSTGSASHVQTVYGIDPNLRAPYTQNYNFTITHELPGNLVLSVAYVGSKSSEQLRSQNLNEVNIIENGILQGFNQVAAGGTSPLIDKIFSSALYPAVATAGGGSNYVRTNSTTLGFFAANNPGGFANFISSTNSLTGVNGGLLTNAGLPLNYIVLNPQFLSAVYTSNAGNSTYNSGQVEVNKRFSHGMILQGSYVLSHAIGDNEGDSTTFSASYRTMRNGHLDKRPLAFDYNNVFKVNGLWELPLGKGKLIGRNANGLVDRIIGGFEIGSIVIFQSGAPLTFSAQNTFNNAAATVSTFTAVQVGKLPDGKVQRVATGIQYFNFTQITDPAVANMSSATLKAISPLKAIADANGNPLLINPAAGQISPLGLVSFRGPGWKNMNLNLIKHIKITERFNFQIGASAQNLTNTPIFGNPTFLINSTSFGRITTVGAGASSSIGAIAPVAGTGARIIVLQGRLNF
jgi:hypothetical protein